MDKLRWLYFFLHGGGSVDGVDDTRSNDGKMAYLHAGRQIRSDVIRLR